MDNQPLTPQKCAAIVALAAAINSGIKVQIATKNPQRYIYRFKHYVGIDIQLMQVTDDLFDVKLK